MHNESCLQCERGKEERLCTVTSPLTLSPVTLTFIASFSVDVSLAGFQIPNTDFELE